MKKFIYCAALAMILGLSFTSCTEEEVKPKAGENNGGVAVETIKK